MIQLREKNLGEEEFLAEAKEIARLCKSYHVPFVINDNVEIAKKVDADGVHVGQSDMEALDVRKTLGEDKIIGVTAKTVEQALKAQAHGADYLGVGAVFGTTSKADATKLDKCSPTFQRFFHLAVQAFSIQPVAVCYRIQNHIFLI